MLDETKNIIYGLDGDFLPLKTYVNITEGNALRIDWNDKFPYGKPQTDEVARGSGTESMAVRD